MAGICGIAHKDRQRPVDAGVLSEMNVAMAHRGPDDSGVWHGDHVALGACRLSVVDLFRGQQLMTNEEKNLVVAFDGRIYNFKQLRAELEGRGHIFTSLSDTEVILRAYQEHGDRCLEYLNGMFAFALYDKPQDRLLIARDRLGIKPLFYVEDGETFAFASELGALLRTGLITGRINPAALDAYFAFLYVPSPDTIFENVHKVRPGEKVVFHNGGIAKETYWRLACQPQDSWRLDAAAEEYFALLADSVKLQSVSDVPLGALLSGGLDSSSVVGLLSQRVGAPVRTFTIAFDETHMKPLRRAKRVALHFGTNHTEKILHPDVVALAGQLPSYFGEPFGDPAAVLIWLAAELAHSQVTVALSGDGGDELFAGPVGAPAASGRLAAPLRSLAETVLRLSPQSERLAKLGLRGPYFSIDSWDALRRARTCFEAELRAQLYAPDIRETVAQCAMDRFQEHIDEVGDLSVTEGALAHDTAMRLPDGVLTRLDRMSMAHSVETRAPLLDHRLVEFAAKLPFSLKEKGRSGKLVPKHALRHLLPSGLLHAPQGNFTLPVERWFRRELRSHFEETVLGPGARNGRFLDQKTVRQLRDAHVQGKCDYSRQLWALLAFEHWLRYIETFPAVSVH